MRKGTYKELREYLNGLYESDELKEELKQLIMERSEKAKKVGLRRFYQRTFDKSVYFFECECGNSGEVGINPLLENGFCPECGRTNIADVYIAHILKDNHLGIDALVLGKFYIRPSDFYLDNLLIAGYSENWVATNHFDLFLNPRVRRFGASPLAISNRIQTLDNFSQTLSELLTEKVKEYRDWEKLDYLIDEGVKEFAQTFKEKVEQRKNKRKARRKLTPRQTSIQKIEEVAQALKDKPVEKDYSLTYLKDLEIAVTFTPEGKVEFPYEKVEEKGGYMIRNLNTKEEIPYETYYSSSNHPKTQLVLDLDENKNVIGVFYEEKTELYDNRNQLKLINKTLGGLYFNSQGKVMFVDNHQKTTRKFPDFLQNKVFHSLKDSLEVFKNSKYNQPELLYGLEYLSAPENEEFYSFYIKRFANYARIIKDVPVLESLAKIGFEQLTKNILISSTRGDDFVNLYKGYTSVYDFLGGKDKEFIQTLRDSNCNAYEFMELINLYHQKDSKDRGVDVMQAKEYEVYRLNQSQKNTLLKYFKGYRKLNDYLENVRNYQCIEPSVAAGILADYIYMAEVLNYDLTNRSILCPNSLKREHDIAVYSYNVVRKEHETEFFKKSVEEYKHLEYETEDNAYQFITPKEPEDLVSEGKKLKHCVASYVSAIRDRATQIIFLRKTEQVNHSFYTIEVTPDGIVKQVKGLQNQAPTKEVVKAIKEWGKEKGLQF